MLLIFFQILALSAVSLGWTYWFHRWTSDGAWTWRSAVVLFAAAFSLQILLLQNLTYLDVPVKYGFVLPGAIGIIGFWLLVGLCRRGGSFGPLFLRNLRYGAAIFVFVFVAQSVSGILQGPSNYYGKGHIDHLNYGLVAEFIKSERFSMPEVEMKKEPWLLKVSQQKNNRIGQSVAQAYVASMSFVPAKEAYAALCSFSVALFSVVVFALAQSFSLRFSYCWLAALWVGLAPATTRIHLDGFLSQAAVLFVFPAIILYARLTDETARFKLLAGSVLFAYLLVSYTDFFLIGLFLLGLLTVGLVLIWSRRQIFISAIVVILSLLLVPAYLPKAVQFAVNQYSFAAGINQSVEVLAPDGGTVYGWMASMVEIPLAHGPLHRQATTYLGFAVMALCVLGLVSRSRRQRFFALSSIFAPTFFLGILLMAPVLAKYPFQKICDSFSFVWILLAMRGVNRIVLAGRVRWPGPIRLAGDFVPGFLLLLGGVGYFAEHRLVATKFEALAALDVPEFRNALHYIADHQDRTYVIRHPYGVAAGWIAYEARKSKVFVLSSWLSDIPLFPGSQSFTQLPDVLERVTFINSRGIRDEATNNGLPDIEVDNPQGEDGAGDARWYWLGESMNVDIYNWSASEPREYKFTFRIEPGPANPSPERNLSITSLRTGQCEPIHFKGSGEVTVPIVLLQGKNTLSIVSDDPLDQLIRLPNEPRIVLTRVLNFALSSPASVNEQDPRIAGLSARDSLPLPLLTPHNPQLEDRSEEGVWYWVGQQMELEVRRSDKSTQKFLYQLAFDAESGPANPDPNRTIRVTNLSDGKVSEASFKALGRIVASFVAAPGSTRLRLEVLSPTIQTVRIPGDARNHMVRASNFRVKLIRGATAPLPERLTR